MSSPVNEASERIGGFFRRFYGSSRKRKDEMRFFAEKLDNIDERVSSTQIALEKFSEAIGAYATHLASHTSAIQELSRSAAELRESSAEQNRVLARITSSLFTAPAHKAPVTPLVDVASPAYRFISELEKRTTDAENLKYRIQSLFTHDIEDRTTTAYEAAERLRALSRSRDIAGCSVKRSLSYRELHAHMQN